MVHDGQVKLPVLPPIDPMLAKAATSVPAQAGAWSYEPKWDGFRALVFRDGDDVVLQSRNGKELGRYFPELLDAVCAEVAPRCVLDGEIVVPREVAGRVRLDWESLSQRIHPAASRVRMLAQSTPAHFIGFDALATGSASLLAEPFSMRRRALSELITGQLAPAECQCHVTRVTDDPKLGTHWLTTFEGAGLDGVVAKRFDGIYRPGKREMVKVKHARDADCVAIGYRIHKSGTGVGSILLGLYRDGQLQMVGGAASFTEQNRVKLLADLEPLRTGADIVYDGEPSRWNSTADKRWIPVRPERVAEVAYDQMEGQRFRHTVHFVRWRPDRDPESCTFDQLDVPLNYDLYDVLES